ncbi:Hypothetical protein, putative [Bodo saltans]|uniref:Uncharacterized protein n=1 Tax=Bodo saltans TaxID=75058 RepID=A0A0S4IXP2_BODSA|nr:Hypothetical protein, putative [Bodo saltans]|eukprot:CUG44529.1 Hypothetical protein, putative [Bodo saltans]
MLTNHAGTVDPVEMTTPTKPQRPTTIPLLSPDRATVDRVDVPARRPRRIASHPIVHRSISETLSSPRSSSPRLAAPTSRPLTPTSQAQRLAATPLAHKGHRPTTEGDAASSLWSPVASKATEAAIERRLLRETSVSVGRAASESRESATAASMPATVNPLATASPTVYGPRRTLAAMGLV